MRVLSSWRRLATSSSVSAVSSRPNSRISARSLARDTFMRSGLTLTLESLSSEASATSASGSPSRSASRSEKSSSASSAFLPLSSDFAPFRPFFSFSSSAAALELVFAGTFAAGADLAVALAFVAAGDFADSGFAAASFTDVAALTAGAGALFFAVMQFLKWAAMDRQRAGRWLPRSMSGSCRLRNRWGTANRRHRLGAVGNCSPVGPFGPQDIIRRSPPSRPIPHALSGP